MVPRVLIKSHSRRHRVSHKRNTDEHSKVVVVYIAVNINIINTKSVSGVEYSRPNTTINRLPPGGEGQASSARGEVTYPHVLTLGRGQQQLVVGDRGAVIQHSIVGPAGRVLHTGSRERRRIESIVELQARGRCCRYGGGERRGRTVGAGRTWAARCGPGRRGIGPGRTAVTGDRTGR